jgi:putative transcriptional regulator
MIQLESIQKSITTMKIPQLLIATCTMDQHSFKEAVILLYQHNHLGSRGLIINRPSDSNLGNIFKQLNIKTNLLNLKDTMIFLGGPVDRNQGLIVCLDSVDQNNLAFDSQHQCLEEIAKGTGPKNFLIALGHTAWAPGQLEDEIDQALWIQRPVDLTLLFDMPIKDRWRAAINQLGFDMRTMTHFPGHD